MASDVLILKILRRGGVFAAEPVADASAGEAQSFTVAMVPSSLDPVGSSVAFACDFLAVAPDAALMAVHPAMLRRRAGAALDGAIDPDGSIRGIQLHTMGLAAFLLEQDADATRERVLKQADTMLALKQARDVSDPDWFNPE